MEKIKHKGADFSRRKVGKGIRKDKSARACDWKYFELFRKRRTSSNRYLFL
jgi:hypothetical protein